MWTDAAIREGRAPRAHFAGIGGTGMVAVARLAIDAGWEVRGSDNPLYPPTSTMVAELGVPVAEGYAAENLDWNPDVVVVGNALSRGNAEIEAVLNRGLSYISFPEWTKEAILRDRKPVAICGTHGKTTTSALTAHLLDRCGVDCGFLIGGQSLDFPHSSRLGALLQPFVIEGDEYDTAFFDKRAKFLHYLPHTAVVTSVEFDHSDIYADLTAVERAFQLMLRQVPQHGRILLCADDAGAMRLAKHAPAPVETYGLSEGATWRATVIETTPEGQRLKISYKEKALGECLLPLFGNHNARNALAAIAVASGNNISFDKIVDALAAFRGLRRRMEVFHQHDGLIFVDDFAHHPTALRETIRAARTRWPNRPVHLLFEPRSNTTATNVFQTELAEALAEADAIHIGPVHRPERFSDGQRLDRERLTTDLKTANTEATIHDTVPDLVEFLADRLGGDEVVLICSNGAFDGIYDRVRKRFSK